MVWLCPSIKELICASNRCRAEFQSQFKTGGVIRVNSEDVLWGCAWDGSNGITFTWVVPFRLWRLSLQNTEIHIQVLGLLKIESEEVLLFILICSSSTRLSLLLEFRCRPLLSYVSPVVEPNIFVCLQMIIAGSLEAAYSLNWGAREIWGKGGGETLALLW